ncbi:MAG: hypothetical protein WED27_11910 [Pirellulales bacterium]
MTTPCSSVGALLLFAIGLGGVVFGANDAPGSSATLKQPAANAIAPADALDHVGKTLTVEFVVAKARKLDDKEICFLNSLKDHREQGNFTAVIFRDGLARFVADGIADPAEEYLGKTIRVSGMVEDRSGQAQIVVESPTQIEVVAVDEPLGPDAQDR